MTIANSEYFDIIDSITSESEDANRWFLQALDAASTWDHIVDRDEIDIEQSDRTMQALITEWGMNPFFQKYSMILIPVMVNVISAWKFSNQEYAPKIKSYDFYTELPTTLAFILGGQSLVDEYIPRLRNVVLTMFHEDEQRDSYKK